MKFFRLLLPLVFCLAVSTPIFAQKMKAEDVLAKHLDSIATAENRAALKNMIAVGDAEVIYISQKNLPAKGRVVIASADKKMFFGMNLNAADYPLEKFISNGKNTSVSFVRPGVRSVLGNFISANNLLVEESLLGGTLSTSWTLLNIANSKAKLSFEGTKKIDDKEVYVLGYSPKGGSDFDINLYFDKETFAHVRTEYKRTASASIGRASVNTRGLTVDDSARQNETRIKIVEDFSDFKVEKGITLPHAYSLNYTTSGQNGTTEIAWKFVLNEFAFNQKLDDNTFNPETE